MLFSYIKVSKSIFVFHAILLILLLTSCEQRDPIAEYEILRETVYNKPREGEAAAQKYIDHFYKEKKAKIAEVSEIRSQYRRMDGFLSETFISYADFLEKGKVLNDELAYTRNTGVSKLWKSLYEKERKRILAPLMDSITRAEFDEFFLEQVRILCENEFNTWSIESIDQVSLSSPIEIEDGEAKKSSGEYRIHLRGNILGSSNSARIAIDGTIGFDQTGHIQKQRTYYSFLDKPFLN